MNILLVITCLIALLALADSLGKFFAYFNSKFMCIERKTDKILAQEISNKIVIIATLVYYYSYSSYHLITKYIYSE